VGEFADLLGQYVGSEPGKLSQREAARRTGVLQQTISLILRGHSMHPESETLQRLTVGLGLDVEEVQAAIAHDRINSVYLQEVAATDRVRNIVAATVAATEALTDEEQAQVLAALSTVMRRGKDFPKP
jgi:transcriptional regulator with XRE-family HTH domain